MRVMRAASLAAPIYIVMYQLVCSSLELGSGGEAYGLFSGLAMRGVLVETG